MESDDRLALARYGMRFAVAETETDYRAWRIVASVPFNRAGLYLSVGLWMTAIPVLYATGVAGRATMTVLAVSIVLPVIGFALIASYRRPWVRFLEPTTGLANFAAGVVAVGYANWTVATDPAHVSNDVGIGMALLANYFGFALLRLPTLYAVLAVLPYMLLEAVLDLAHLRATSAAASSYALNAFVLTSGFVTGLAINVVLDVTSRRTFRQERIIESQKDTIARERARSENILKTELSHQVAERSRELGALLALADAPIARMDMSPGARFDARYKIVRPLGEGGMGAVYEVERLTDGQSLALKVVTGSISRANVVRFAREAEIGARMRHENLVPIVDVGVAANGAPFLVMELVSGSSLEDCRDRFGRLEWAMPILGQIARGLGALHDAGIVHRDLKPANVLLSGAEEAPLARISDFGISRFDDAAVDATGITADARERNALTAAGAMLGTPLYMAPETANGGRVDSAADVFAFGIVAYELLTGRTPFAMPPVVLAMAGQTLPTPEPLRDVDGDIADVVTACLRATPSERPRMREIVTRVARDNAL